MKAKTTKFVFVLGGVISGLGKGIIAASLGSLFKINNQNIFLKKIDPYLNVDPGTMNPDEHGEVFVTSDGGETDLDVGHYERFTNINLSKKSCITAGQLYQQIIANERQGNFGGKTVQMIPHFRDFVINLFNELGQKGYDVVIVELGGTIGDIEQQIFLESIRSFINKYGRSNCLIVMVGHLIYLPITQEYKTKPIQNALKILQSSGLNANIIIVRNQYSADQKTLDKVISWANLQKNNVISIPDVNIIYAIPKLIFNSSLPKELFSFLNPNYNMKKLTLGKWKNFVPKEISCTVTKVVIIAGKYIGNTDSYLSIREALCHVGLNLKITIKWQIVNTRKIKTLSDCQVFSKADAIIIPGGFGVDGFEGKVLVAGFARKNNIPCLGICYGMHAMLVEFARNVLNKKNANTTENDKFTSFPVVCLLTGHNSDEDLGGTLRLGEFSCNLSKNSLIHRIYGENMIHERHRHRYEVNNAFCHQFEEKGMIFSGIHETHNLKEVLEIKTHKFFVGVQFHPEFLSRPNAPAPLFFHLIKATM